MANCKNCIHGCICGSACMNEPDGCGDFKDKSKIVELPCKADDVLYVTEYDVDSDKSYIEKVKVSSIEIDEYGISIYCKTVEGNYDTYVPNDFGDSIFLTSEEAERALEEAEQ